jgi:hypothetical protein
MPILNENSWNIWIRVTEFEAKSLGVWELVDPSRDRPEYPIPRKPIPADAKRKPRITTPSENTPSEGISMHQFEDDQEIDEESLTEIEEKRLRRLERQYEKKKKGLIEFLVYLSTTVESPFFEEAMYGDTLYDKMVILRDALKPRGTPK